MAVTDPNVVLYAIVLGLLAVTFAVGLLFPGRRRIALRVVAGAVVLLYIIYFDAELVALLRGEPQKFQPGRPSALMAGFGILMWAIPLFIYTVTGRTRGERRWADLVAQDTSWAVRDRLALERLVKRGADLSLETDVRFYLVVASEQHARSAENIVLREGYSIEIFAPKNSAAQWICCVSQRAVPSWENIRAARERFTSLASALGGVVAGWETQN